MSKHKVPIYFDNNATTQTDDRVIEAMLPFFSTKYGNPSSHHSIGEETKKAIDQSRNSIADLLNVFPQEIIFTSGATEAINLAIKGISEARFEKGRHIITTQTEHSAVLDICKHLEKRGFEVDYLPVDNYGLVDITQLETKIRKDTILVSVIFVNNETGVIQPIKEIAETCKSKNVLLFTDATQAVGKIPIDVKELNVDLMSFSGHKFYGPKGVGGLFCRKDVKLEAQLHGGGHEQGLRSGTLNVPGIVGLAKAFELAVKEMQINIENVKALRDKLEGNLLSMGGIKLNGHLEHRLFNVSSICFSDTDPFLINGSLKDVAFSQGSACNSWSIQPSHVLKSMGLSDKEALSSFRFSFGKYNTEDEIYYVSSMLKEILKAKEVLNKV